MKESEIVEVVGGSEIDSQSAAMVKAAVKVIPNADQLMASSRWEPIKALLMKAAAKAKLVKVKSPEDRETAQTYARLLQPKVKKLDDKRLQITREIRSRLIDPINEKMNPVIKEGKDAVHHLKKQVSDYDLMLIEKRREEQRKADAEAVRRQKLQDAAVARGGMPRKEIVAKQVAMPEVVVTDRSTYWHLAYFIQEPDMVPLSVEFNGKVYPLCKPDPGLIRAMVTDIEKTFEKEQKGFVDVPQPAPGILLKWKQTMRV